LRGTAANQNFKTNPTILRETGTKFKGFSLRIFLNTSS